MRRFIRDFVDSRFSFIELMLPLLVVTMVLGYSGNATAAPDRQHGPDAARSCWSSSTWCCCASGCARSSRARFPDEPTKGTTYYAITRALQMRFMRLPKATGEDRPGAPRALPVTTGFGVGLTAALVAALLFGLGAVVQAHAVRRMETPAVDLRDFLRTSARDPWTVGVVVAYLVGFALHAVAIWLLPLYLAQAAIAMSLPVTAVASTVLHERLTPMHWSAVAVVTVGMVLLSAGSGEAGAVVVHGGFALALWLGAAALAFASWRGVGRGAGTLAPSRAWGTPAPRSPSGASGPPSSPRSSRPLPRSACTACWRSGSTRSAWSGRRCRRRPRR